MYVSCSFIIMMLFFAWNFSLFNSNSLLYLKCLCKAKLPSSSTLLKLPLDQCAGFIHPKFICTFKRLDFYEKEIDILVIGANIGELIRLLFTRIDDSTKFNSLNDNDFIKYNHSYMYIFMVIITTIQLTTSLGKYLNYFQYTCIDFLSVESLPYIWIEWMSTVPLMLYLVNTINNHLSIFVLCNHYIEILGGLGIFFLFLGLFPFPFYLHIIFFILSHLSMVLALYWLLEQSYNVYMITYEKFVKIPINKRYDIVHKIILDDYRIATRKLNCTIQVTIAFSLFPVLYYFRLWELLNREYYIISLLLLGFLTKRLCIQSNLNIHFNIIEQPIKHKFIDDSRNKAESKLKFLKYVFHTIRVTLNSLALGLQVLKEASVFNEIDNEILTSMRDGMILIFIIFGIVIFRL